MTKTEQIIEGLKIFNRYEHKIYAHTDAIWILTEYSIDLDDQNKLISLNWKFRDQDHDYWSINC